MFHLISLRESKFVCGMMLHTLIQSLDTDKNIRISSRNTAWRQRALQKLRNVKLAPQLSPLRGNTLRIKALTQQTPLCQNRQQRILNLKHCKAHRNLFSRSSWWQNRPTASTLARALQDFRRPGKCHGSRVILELSGSHQHLIFHVLLFWGFRGYNSTRIFNAGMLQHGDMRECSPRTLNKEGFADK